jgi:hypothetical protein
METYSKRWRLWFPDSSALSSGKGRWGQNKTFGNKEEEINGKTHEHSEDTFIS